MTTITNPKKNDVTNFVIFWLIVILFGPYIQYKTPFRLDHIVLPVIFLGLLGYYIRQKRRYSIPVYFYPLALFIGIVCFASLNTIQSDEYPFHIGYGLGDFENHIRILMYAVIVWILGIFFKIEARKLLIALFWISVLLGVFGIFQTIPTSNQVVDKLIRQISISLYEGGHFREKGTVDLCLGSRAVSTFYSPGNLGLFLGLVCCLFYCCPKVFSLKKIDNILGAFIIMITGILSISKVFLGFCFLIPIWMICRRNLRTAIFFCFIFSISFLIVEKFSPYATHVYKINIQSLSFPVDFYNTWVGPRFGKIELKVDPASETSGFRIGERYDYSQLGAGYLDDYLTIVTTHPVIGVGYALVKSGDSMLNHLLVRSGGLGAISFLVFLFLVVRKMYQPLHKQNTILLQDGVSLCLFGFLIGGIAFPTFIQDRSGDVFWMFIFLSTNSGFLFDVAEEKNIEKLSIA